VRDNIGAGAAFVVLVVFLGVDFRVCASTDGSAKTVAHRSAITRRMQPVYRPAAKVLLIAFLNPAAVRLEVG
jgi:hypothetical protein